MVRVQNVLWKSPMAVQTTIILFYFRDDMKNSFNLLLVSLICFDSWYLFGSILENLRRNFGMGTHLHAELFPYFLYPFQSVSMSGSIFMTVAIALERYIAVHYPIGKDAFLVPKKIHE